MAPGSIEILPLIETGKGVHEAVNVLSASPRVRTGIFGFVDYMLDVGIHTIDHTDDAAELLMARSYLVMACAAAGVQPPLDGPFLGVGNAQALPAQCRQARRLGYQGKMLIHPSQISPSHEGFGPEASEVVQAERIVAAFSEAEGRGVAAIIVDDRLVDYPIFYRAQRIIEAAT